MEQRSISEKELEKNIEIIQSSAETDVKFLSPIDLSVDITTPLKLPKLLWLNISLQPTKMKLTNTGHTVILSGKWSQQRPHLSRGPLLANYVFSQIHFHWGANEQEGSEHTTNGKSFPLEMHVVFFKSVYLTQEAALKHTDGVIVVAYLFKNVDTINSSLKAITNVLPNIIETRTSTHIQPLPLTFFLNDFSDDYLCYWGGVQTQNCTHTILWFISRQAFGVKSEQLEAFRQLQDTKSMKMVRNFRDTFPLESQSVFHVNPSSNISDILLPGIIHSENHAPSIMVNYNFSNIFSLNKHRFKKGKFKDEQKDSKQFISNIFRTDKIIFMGSKDIGKKVGKNVLKVLTELDSEDITRKEFGSISRNANSEFQDNNEENKRNKRVKNSLGVQRKNIHQINLMKLQQAIEHFNKINNLVTEDNISDKVEMNKTNENQERFDFAKNNTKNDQVIKKMEECKTKDENVQCKSLGEDHVYLSNKNEEENKKIQRFTINSNVMSPSASYYRKRKYKRCLNLSVYKTKSERIQMVSERKLFERRRKIKQVEEKRKKIMELYKIFYKNHNCKAKNTHDLRNNLWNFKEQQFNGYNPVKSITFGNIKPTILDKIRNHAIKSTILCGSTSLLFTKANVLLIKDILNNVIEKNVEQKKLIDKDKNLKTSCLTYRQTNNALVINIRDGEELNSKLTNLNLQASSLKYKLNLFMENLRVLNENTVIKSENSSNDKDGKYMHVVSKRHSGNKKKCIKSNDENGICSSKPVCPVTFKTKNKMITKTDTNSDKNKKTNGQSNYCYEVVCSNKTKNKILLEKMHNSNKKRFLSEFIKVNHSFRGKTRNTDVLNKDKENKINNVNNSRPSSPMKYNYIAENMLLNMKNQNKERSFSNGSKTNSPSRQNMDSKRVNNRRSSCNKSNIHDTLLDDVKKHYKSCSVSNNRGTDLPVRFCTKCKMVSNANKKFDVCVSSSMFSSPTKSFSQKLYSENAMKCCNESSCSNSSRTSDLWSNTKKKRFSNSEKNLFNNDSNNTRVISPTKNNSIMHKLSLEYIKNMDEEKTSYSTIRTNSLKNFKTQEELIETKSESKELTLNENKMSIKLLENAANDRFNSKITSGLADKECIKNMLHRYNDKEEEEKEQLISTIIIENLAEECKFFTELITDKVKEVETSKNKDKENKYIGNETKKFENGLITVERREENKQTEDNNQEIDLIMNVDNEQKGKVSDNESSNVYKFSFNMDFKMENDSRIKENNKCIIGENSMKNKFELREKVDSRYFNTLVTRLLSKVDMNEDETVLEDTERYINLQDFKDLAKKEENVKAISKSLKVINSPVDNKIYDSDSEEYFVQDYSQAISSVSMILLKQNTSKTSLVENQTDLKYSYDDDKLQNDVIDNEVQTYDFENKSEYADGMYNLKIDKSVKIVSPSKQNFITSYSNPSEDPENNLSILSNFHDENVEENTTVSQIQHITKSPEKSTKSMENLNILQCGFPHTDLEISNNENNCKTISDKTRFLSINVNNNEIEELIKKSRETGNSEIIISNKQHEQNEPNCNCFTENLKNDIPENNEQSEIQENILNSDYRNPLAKNKPARALRNISYIPRPYSGKNQSKCVVVSHIYNNTILKSGHVSQRLQISSKTKAHIYRDSINHSTIPLRSTPDPVYHEINRETRKEGFKKQFTVCKTVCRIPFIKTDNLHSLEKSNKVLQSAQNSSIFNTTLSTTDEKPIIKCQNYTSDIKKKKITVDEQNIDLKIKEVCDNKLSSRYKSCNLYVNTKSEDINLSNIFVYTKKSENGNWFVIDGKNVTKEKDLSNYKITAEVNKINNLLRSVRSSDVLHFNRQSKSSPKMGCPRAKSIQMLCAKLNTNHLSSSTVLKDIKNQDSQKDCEVKSVECIGNNQAQNPEVNNNLSSNNTKKCTRDSTETVNHILLDIFDSKSNHEIKMFDDLESESNLNNNSNSKSVLEEEGNNYDKKELIHLVSNLHLNKNYNLKTLSEEKDKSYTIEESDFSKIKSQFSNNSESKLVLEKEDGSYKVNEFHSKIESKLPNKSTSKSVSKKIPILKQSLQVNNGKNVRKSYKRNKHYQLIESTNKCSTFEKQSEQITLTRELKPKRRFSKEVINIKAPKTTQCKRNVLKPNRYLDTISGRKTADCNIKRYHDLKKNNNNNLLERNIQRKRFSITNSNSIQSNTQERSRISSSHNLDNQGQSTALETERDNHRSPNMSNDEKKQFQSKIPRLRRDRNRI